ncbi:MAG: VOC family protein [Pseudomonadota bacterium]|nr:VOC family protein [Pseudomonadota bacterium]
MTIDWKNDPVRLDHVMLLSAEPARLAAFYQNALCMKATTGGTPILLQGAGRKLLIDSGPSKTLGFGAYSFSSDASLKRFRTTLEDQGSTIEPSPSPLFDNSAFSVFDPDRNRIVFGVSDSDIPDKTRPARLQHLVLATDEMAPMVDFYTTCLGFRMIDKVEDDTGDLRACFFNSDLEHHSFAFFKATEKRLDHHAYEVGEWGLIRDWADHMATLAVPIVWGPGRHGPGNNLFFMVHDPDKNWVEFSAELEQLTDDRTLRTWPHGEKALNLWGPGYLRS